MPNSNYKIIKSEGGNRLESNNNTMDTEQLKKDITQIKENLNTRMDFDEKLNNKISMLENKITSTNKWIITLSIIAIICVTAMSLVVLLKK